MINIYIPRNYAKKYRSNVIQYINQIDGGKSLDKLKKLIDSFNDLNHTNLSLRKLILLSPKELEKYKQYYVYYLRHIPTVKKEKKLIYDPNKDFSILKEYYKKISKLYGIEILEKSGVRVCPYCNAKYIFTLDKRRNCQFDHFFNEANYPIFAISLFNLIPSCRDCNFHKHSSDKLLVNPYSKDLKKEPFEFSLNYLHQIELNYKLGSFAPELSTMKSVLHLDAYYQGLPLGEQLYESFENMTIEELCDRKNYFYDRLSGTTSKKTSIITFKRSITGNYGSDADFLKICCSKATKDVANQFGILSQIDSLF